MREWLNAQAAGGYVDYDPEEQAMSSRPSTRSCLADESSPFFMPGAFQLTTSAVRDEPRISEAFRSGAGVGWHEHDDGVFEGSERFFRPGYAANLVPRGSRRSTASRRSSRRRARRRRRLRPRRLDDPDGGGVPGVDVRRLRLPRRVDRAARQRAEEAGVGDRVHFEVAPAARLPRDGLRPRRDVRLPARHGRSGRRRRSTCRGRSPPTARG